MSALADSPLSLEEYLITVAEERYRAHSFLPLRVTDSGEWERDDFTMDEGWRYTRRVYLQSVPAEAQPACGKFIVEFGRDGLLSCLGLEVCGAFLSGPRGNRNLS